MTLSNQLVDARARILEDVREQLPANQCRVRLAVLAREPLSGRQDAVIVVRDEAGTTLIMNPVAVIDLLEAVDDTRQILAALAQLSFYDDDLIKLLAERACSSKLSQINSTINPDDVDEIEALLRAREAACRTPEQDHQTLNVKPLR